MSRGGGNDTKETTTKAEPYGPSEPYLQDIMNEAASLMHQELVCNIILVLLLFLCQDKHKHH